MRVPRKDAFTAQYTAVQHNDDIMMMLVTMNIDKMMKIEKNRMLLLMMMLIPGLTVDDDPGETMTTACSILAAYCSQCCQPSYCR